MLEAYFRSRLHPKLNADERRTLYDHLLLHLEVRTFPAYRGRWIDVEELAENTGIPAARLLERRPELQPLCDAICRAAGDPPMRAQRSHTAAGARTPKTRRPPADAQAKRASKNDYQPSPLWTTWSDPQSLGEALRLHMARHGDSLRSLHAFLLAAGPTPSLNVLATWRRGSSMPSNAVSFAALRAIERRYRLPDVYFEAKVERRGRTRTAKGVAPIAPSERRRLAWHLPDDFPRRSAAEQEEILGWVREVVISGSTEYRRFQAAASKTRYALRFVGLNAKLLGAGVTLPCTRSSALTVAPERLRSEMADLLRFKTATLTARGLRRTGVWNAETAAQKVEHFALMFGALAADPDGEIIGCGVDLDKLALALLVFPAVWDWYLSWREKRRGFYTA